MRRRGLPAGRDLVDAGSTFGVHGASVDTELDVASSMTDEQREACRAVKLSRRERVRRRVGLSRGDGRGRGGGQG
jgi:hypothetical protein